MQGSARSRIWNRQIPLGELHASEQAARELLIDRPPVTPGLRQVEVIEELIEPGHLGGLQRLVGDQRSLQDPERRRAKGGPRERSPGDPEFRVDLILIDIPIAAQGVETEPQRGGHVFQEIDVRVRVHVEVFEILVGHRLDLWIGRGKPDRRVVLAIDTEVSGTGLQVKVPRAEQVLELDAKSSFGNLGVDEAARPQESHRF